MLMIYEMTETGAPRLPKEMQNQAVQEMLSQAKAHYQKVGFKRPWIGYLVFEKGVFLGSCGFKTPPAEGKVEIFYSPLPEHNTPIVQADMISRMIEIALFHDKNSWIFIKSLPQEIEKNQFFKSLGLTRRENVNDPQSGKVLEWGIDWGGKYTPSPGPVVVVRK